MRNINVGDIVEYFGELRYVVSGQFVFTTNYIIKGRIMDALTANYGMVKVKVYTNIFEE
jgi:hypothetical protein